MADEKKTVKKNPNPLIVKGIFYVTAEFEDKQYVVSNGLSFIRFKKEGEEIAKGDYVEIHGPVYQRKDAANPIVTGEALVKKLSEDEVTEYKKKLDAHFGAGSDKKAAPAKKTSAKKTTDKKLPWE